MSKIHRIFYFSHIQGITKYITIGVTGYPKLCFISTFFLITKFFRWMVESLCSLHKAPSCFACGSGASISSPHSSWGGSSNPSCASYYLCGFEAVLKSSVSWINLYNVTNNNIWQSKLLVWTEWRKRCKAPKGISSI